MGALQELARELGAQERTLRRAAAQGTLRSRRSRPRQLRLDPGEREYLGMHWELLSRLREALRTDRAVRLAVLYGSFARGDEDASSDLDVLVATSNDTPTAVRALAQRLSEASGGRRIDLAHLEPVERKSPLLLDRVLDEGRVLVDRDEQWPALRNRRRAIRARADRAFKREMAEAASALRELVQ